MILSTFKMFKLKLSILAIAMVVLSLISCDEKSNDPQPPNNIDTTIIDTNAVDTNFIDTAGTLIGVWDIVAYPTLPKPTPVTSGAYIIFSPDSIWVYYGEEQDYALNDKGTYYVNNQKDSLYLKFTYHPTPEPGELIYHSDTVAITSFIKIYPSFYGSFTSIMIKRRP
jgi:hypothetical protein